MLCVEDIHVSYGKQPILRGLSFSVEEGEILAILGPNGAGKTTLVKGVGWILTPSAGRITLDQRDIGALSRKQRAQILGYVPQRSIPADVTVHEAVLVGRTPYLQWGGPSAKDQEIVERILTLLNLTSIATRRTSTLSGGQLQQVIIARALAQEPRVLLLDEPINHLDIHNRIEVLALIQRITRELGIHTLIVIHDINTALQLADRFLLLKEGRLIDWGDLSVITAETIEQTFSLSVKLQTIDNQRYVFNELPGAVAHNPKHL